MNDMASPSHASNQFHQLPMFMTAREIRRDYQALDEDRDESMDIDSGALDIESDDDVYARKYSETHGALRDSILQTGVENPIALQVPDFTGSLGKPQVLGGHHRVAVMEIHKPDTLMPVEHFRGQRDAKTSLGDRY